jgi:alpha-ketoglutarate-dependent taurine dioxygenase
MSAARGTGMKQFGSEVANEATAFGLLLTNQGSSRALSEFPAEELRELLHRFGFVVIRGCEISRSRLTELMAGLGPLAEFPSGTAVDLRGPSATDETAFSNREMKFHQDGAPFAIKSRYVALLCEEAPEPEEGGETFVSFLREFMRRSPQDLIGKLRRLTVDYRTTSAEFAGRAAGTRTQSCMIRHPDTREDVAYLSINNPDDDHYSYVSKFSQLAHDESEALMREVETAMMNRDIFYEHRWRSGDCMILDNLLVSHGRRAYRRTSKRRVVRVTTQLTSPIEAASA